MSGTKEDLIKYRIFRAKDTLDDAHIIAAGIEVLEIESISDLLIAPERNMLE